LPSLVKILDVGCGPGIYVEQMLAQGLDAYGVDVERPPAESPRLQRLSVFDSSFPVRYCGRFDLVLSLEVGEHLPGQLAFEYVRRLVDCLSPSGRRTILFSAAHPGQGGDGHINCQPKAYWLDLFRFAGMSLDEIATEDMLRFMTDGPHMGWFRMNAMILVPTKSTFGERNFEAIASEELPQATRLATYLAGLG
jgi:SAM-dependent methyltransferase